MPPSRLALWPPATWPLAWQALVSGQWRGPLPDFLMAFLEIAALVYEVLVRSRQALYDAGLWTPRTLPVPVVSIGNLTVGGTGKTPFTELVCRHLMALGHRPAIVMRGYAATTHGSDEAALLADHLPSVPVIVCAHRYAGGLRAVGESKTTVVVLDDGFQHRRLHRDLDILLWDAATPRRANQLLPAGLRREPLGAANRAHLRFVTGYLPGGGEPFATEPTWHGWAVHEPLDWLWHAPPDHTGVSAPSRRLPLSAMVGRRVGAFCGLGHPQRFADTLRHRLAVNLVAWRAFADHHPYTAEDLADLAADPARPEVWVTTEKDYRRLLWLPPAHLTALGTWAVLRIGMVLRHGHHHLLAALAGLPRPAAPR